jgi:hypothetical protein
MSAIRREESLVKKLTMANFDHGLGAEATFPCGLDLDGDRRG